MRDTLRIFVAEFIGTFALVFVGGASIMSARLATGTGPLLPALAYGVIVAVMMSAFLRVSAAFNPALSLALVATRKISPVTFGVHLAAQLLAAGLAAQALQGNMPPEAVTATRVGGQSVITDVTTAQAIFLEAAATFFFVIVAFGTTVDAKAPKVGGFAAGLSATAGMLAIGSITGGSLNPARSFGPAFVSGIWEGHAIYWIGPMIGALLAGLAYQLVFLSGDDAAA